MTAEDARILVENLSSSLSHGGVMLKNVPALLKELLVSGGWRDFETRRHERVHHENFVDFVTTPPLKGLGSEPGLIDRIVGTRDPELLILIRQAKRMGRGSRTDLVKPGVDSTLGKGYDAALTSQRLARDHPAEYEAVKRGEKNVNAAALDAGIRSRRVMIRLDDPHSAARTLRKHMTPEAVKSLVSILVADGFGGQHGRVST